MKTSRAGDRRPWMGRACGLVCALSLSVLLLPLAAGCGDDLAGTTWKASALGNDITLSFEDEGVCTVTWGLAGMESQERSGPYTVDGDNVTVGEGDEMMGLTRDGDTMKGTAQGIGLTFRKQ